MTSDCPICELVSAPGDPGQIDASWYFGILPGFEVPGWMVLALRRHAEFVTGMDHAEAQSFGPILQAAAGALKIAASAERVYMMAFGERDKHWHVLLLGRTADIPVEQQRAALFLERERLLDAVACARVAREALRIFEYPASG